MSRIRALAASLAVISALISPAQAEERDLNAENPPYVSLLLICSRSLNECNVLRGIHADDSEAACIARYKTAAHEMARILGERGKATGFLEATGACEDKDGNVVLEEKFIVKIEKGTPL